MNPIDMILFCPECGRQHIDEPQSEKNWDNPPHRSHECQYCGHVWRPADVPTNGVAEIETKGQRDQVPHRFTDLQKAIFLLCKDLNISVLSEDHSSATLNFQGVMEVDYGVIGELLKNKTIEIGYRTGQIKPYEQIRREIDRCSAKDE